MKKILITLLIFLFCIPLFGQELSLSKNNREELIENFFNTDTTKTDTVYIIEYRYYENDFYSQYNPYYNWFYSDFYWSYRYNWYYNDFYWSYRYNWYYDNYHRHYSKPRPRKPIRQRTIATRVNHKPDRKREYVRPVRTTETRYNRPQSTTRVKQVRNTNTRSPRTYNRPANRPTSTYNKSSTNQRRYNNLPVRSSSQRSSTVRSSNSSNNRSGTSTRSSSSGGSSSRGRR